MMPDVMPYTLITENAKDVPETYRFVASNIKGCYISWSRSLPSGEIRIGDTVYLSVPNGWDERLQYYPWYTGHIYWQYNQWNYPEQDYADKSATENGARGNEGHYNYYHGNETNLDVYLNRNRFSDKLLIWYKKYEPKPTLNFELSPILENPAPPIDKRTQVRLRLFIQNANTTVSFGVKFVVVSGSSVSYSYDFGDGITASYTQNSNAITHTYVSAGYYVVDVNLDSYSSDSEVKLQIVYGNTNTEIVSSSTSSNILRSLYINTSYKLFWDTLVLSGYTTLDWVYINIPNDQYRVIVSNNTHIDNLYIYLNYRGEGLGHIVLENKNSDRSSNSVIETIHLNSYVHGLDISYYVFTGSEHIYFYSLLPVKVSNYLLYSPSLMCDDFSTLSGLTFFYVRNSVLVETQKLNRNLPVYIF